MKEERPWGSYEILYEDMYCKVKKIIVNPHKKLSYQSHLHRKENWVITKGGGFVVINEDMLPIEANQSIVILPEDKHRISAGEQGIEFIEVQTGSYFGEDDIIRYEDEYGRI